ncbi:MAG: aspartate/tyrosine/aromatic aminotransferase [Phycisphaerae bacterium]|nr:aspartate/tyrosine/aromatic aminotransferase [Phycisphaerae bacterium]
MSDSSLFSQIQQAPPDPILGLTEAFNADQNPKKVTLGVGVYQNSTGKVPVLTSVRHAEARWFEQETTKSYLPIDGVAAYNKAVQILLLGADSPRIAQNQTVTVQTLGGTGALKIGADFLKNFFNQSTVWISNPSWENHRQIFQSAGFPVQTYPYYDPKTNGLDFDGMYNTIKNLPAKSIVLLHACCHNPTGVDPTPEQWTKLVELSKTHDLIPFIDFAYQGFGDGIEEDAFALRSFAQANISCLIANSFSKSMSLYRERVGALTILTDDADESKRVLSQLKRIIRTNYSNPPAHGAQVAALILNDEKLRAQWEIEVAQMRNRIQQMRTEFVKTLSANGVKQNFDFITQQKGMFSYTGLSKETVHKLRNQFALYLVDSGRACIAAMNEKNLPYICQSIASVLKE